MWTMDSAKSAHLMQVVYSLVLGGSERLACDLALRLDPRRNRSSICALAHGGPLAGTLHNAAIPFHIIGCGPGFQWRVVPKLYRLFRDNKVDVVQTHHLKQLVYSAIGARLAGAALVHVEHEHFSLRPPRARWLLRLMAPLCHHIVAIGDDVKTFLVNGVGLPAARITVIPNGVDVARYQPEPRRARDALGLRPHHRLIGHVARLEPEKDQVSLLQAFRTVADAHPDVRLVIVGDGSQRRELERAATELGVEGRVDFLGVREDVPDLLPHFDVFVLSSSSEGLPLSILEAMACARPVVATAVGEISRVVTNGVTGMTVPPGNAPALAHAMSMVLDRPAWAAAMGAAARRLVESAYSLTRVVEQYQALYASVYAARGYDLPTLADSDITPPRTR